MHWDWFAIFVLGLAIIGFRIVAEKLERVAKALESMTLRQGGGSEGIVTKLDGIRHYLQNLREKFPPRP